MIERVMLEDRLIVVEGCGEALEEGSTGLFVGALVDFSGGARSYPIIRWDKPWKHQDHTGWDWVRFEVVKK